MTHDIITELAEKKMKLHKRVSLRVASWALYDFANTIFSANIISLYFALWVTIDKKAEDIVYSLTLSISMILAAVLEPILGTISDIYKKRMPFLILFTVQCCLFTALMGITQNLFIGLLLFCFANLCFQLAAIFYNALLFNVSKDGNLGKISGLGVGLGYLGALTGVMMVKPFALRYGYSGTFIPTAVLFFIFSLPCFLWVRETRREETGHVEFNVGRIFLRLKDTFRNSKKYPGLMHFLFASFIFLNAINTVIIFMAVYTKKVIGFSDSEVINFFAFSTITAIMGSFLFGLLTDRLGAKRVLNISLGIWVIGLSLASISFSKIVFWFVGPLIGVALASTWTSSRALAIKLCPKEKLGEIFGLFGVVGKSASIIGPIVWGICILVFEPLGIMRYRIAIFIQILLILLGWRVLRRLPLTPPHATGI